jgi:hypothetical protein
MGGAMMKVELKMTRLAKKHENVRKRKMGMGGKTKVEKKRKEEAVEEIREITEVDEAVRISLFRRQHQSECLTPIGISLFRQ